MRVNSIHNINGNHNKYKIVIMINIYVSNNKINNFNYVVKLRHKLMTLKLKQKTNNWIIITICHKIILKDHLFIKILNIK